MPSHRWRPRGALCPRFHASAVAARRNLPAESGRHWRGPEAGSAMGTTQLSMPSRPRPRFRARQSAWKKRLPRKATMTLRACSMRRQSSAQRTPGIFGRLIVAATNLSQLRTIGVVSASSGFAGLLRRAAIERRNAPANWSRDLPICSPILEHRGRGPPIEFGFICPEQVICPTGRRPCPRIKTMGRSLPPMAEDKSSG